MRNGADAWDTVGQSYQYDKRDRLEYMRRVATYGSAIRRSVSLRIRFGKAIVYVCP